MTGLDRKTGLETLGEAECWAVLGRHQVGRLAVVASGRPDIFPVNYRLADRSIVVNTAPGTKLAVALLGPAVAFEVDGIDVGGRTGWSVVVHGRAEELTTLEDLLEAEDLQIDSWSSQVKGRYLRVVADEITGRRLP
ncbi:MAG: pyridoxamine 5'-phosphate oxidase family protein [Acidimicrobiales bacterium]